jgi:hypothetical protein
VRSIPFLYGSYEGLTLELFYFGLRVGESLGETGFKREVLSDLLGKFSLGSQMLALGERILGILV